MKPVELMPTLEVGDASELSAAMVRQHNRFVEQVIAKLLNTGAVYSDLGLMHSINFDKTPSIRDVVLSRGQRVCSIVTRFTDTEVVTSVEDV